MGNNREGNQWVTTERETKMHRGVIDLSKDTKENNLNSRWKQILIYYHTKKYHVSLLNELEIAGRTAGLHLLIEVCKVHA